MRLFAAQPSPRAIDTLRVRRPELLQYRSVILKHEAEDEDEQFEYSGTNGFTARIEAVAPAGG